MASADNDLPDELDAIIADIERQAEFVERLRFDRLTKLAEPLNPEAGECGTILGTSFKIAIAGADSDIALSILAANAAHRPECQADPIGYTDTTENGERRIDIYWPKVEASCGAA